jgi:ParB family chromosome partitioning protein
MVESNMQRSLRQNMKHSERARIVTLHYTGLKRQGERKDLKSVTSAEVVQKSEKLDTREIVAKRHRLNRGQVEQYLRIDKLSDALKHRLDEGEFKIATAVEISFLSKEFDLIDKVLFDTKYKLNLKKAKKLRKAVELSITDTLAEHEIKSILYEENNDYSPLTNIKIPTSTYNEFLKLYEDHAEAMENIEKALDEYLQKYSVIETKFVDIPD